MLLRAGIRACFEGSQYHVFQDLDTIAEAVAAPHGEAELVFVAARLDGDAVEPLQALRTAYPKSRIAFYVQSIHLSIERLADVFRTSLDACLTPDMSANVIRQSLDLMMMGERVFPFSLVNEALAQRNEAHRGLQEAPAALPLLSDRERQVLGLLPKGASNKFIARELNISEATVKIHIRTLLKKIGVENRTQAALWALQHPEFFGEENG